MNYQKIYDNLICQGISRASTRKATNEILSGYCERHHIIPKCMGGSNEKDNLVFLSAREHFLVHILLLKLHPEIGGLYLACSRMMYDKQGNKLNGKKYEVLKRKISIYKKSRNKYNDKGLARSSEKQKGRTKETHEGVARSAEKQIGRTKENHEGIAEGTRKRTGRNKDNYEPAAITAAKLIGRAKETHEGPRKISEKKKGQTKKTCAGVAIMAEKILGRRKEDYEYLAERSRKMTGTTKENNEGVARMAEKKTKVPDEVKMEIYNKYESGISHKEIHRWLTHDLGYDVHFRFTSRVHNTIRREKAGNPIVQI